MNNPLEYTDPTGYTWFSRLGRALGSVGRTAVTIGVAIGVGIAVTAICAATGGLGAVAIVAIAGASSGLAGAELGTAFAGGSEKDYLINGAIGIGSGALGGIAGYYAGGLCSSLASKGFLSIGTGSTSPILNGAVTGALGGMGGGAAGGYVGGFISGFIQSGGNWDAANKAGLVGMESGFLLGGGIGLVTGTYGGIKYAKRQMVNPWTGKSLINKDALSALKDYYGNKGDDGLLDCSDLASRLRGKVGSGDIYEITPKSGQWMNGMEYGQVEQFQFHQVYVNDGVVYDPMYSNNPISYDDYINFYKSMNSGNIQINKEP